MAGCSAQGWDSAAEMDRCQPMGEGLMSGPNNKSEVAATVICLLLMIATGVFLTLRVWVY